MNIIQTEEFARAAKAFKGARRVRGAGTKIGKMSVKAGTKGKKVVIKAGKKAKQAGGKAVQSAKEAGEKAAKFAKDNPEMLKKAAKYGAAAAVVGGGAMYMNKKLKDKNEAVKGCVQVCLPDGYDEVVYGGKPTSSLKYRTLDSVKAKGADVDADQPFCTAGVENCGDFCTAKCEDANPLEVPGGALISGAAGAAGSAAKGAAGLLGKGAGFIGKGVWAAIKWPVYIGSGVCCCIILVYFLMMMPKKGPGAAAVAPPPPRYY
jgi:hypothetical protein